MPIRTEILAQSALLAVFAQGGALAEQSSVGEAELKSHCAGCHGLDGEGNGPFVDLPKAKPPSLTHLSRASRGVFPFQSVYQVIDGTRQISGHGTKDMPVWGDRYAAEIIRQYGELGTEHPQTGRCRILELVFYLATIQKP